MTAERAFAALLRRVLPADRARVLDALRALAAVGAVR